MRTYESFIGRQFGELTVLANAGRSIHRNILVSVRCSCGNETVVTVSNLRSGATSSCGCVRRKLARLAKTTHGMSHTPTYISWAGMKQRCLDQDNPGYPDYGGRGITICERWMSFENFCADMGDRPKGTSLDRIDNDGPYSPGNCRWASRITQNNNQRDSHIINVNGVSLTVAEWSRKVGISQKTLIARVSRLGWDAETAIATPTRRWARRNIDVSL